MNVSFACYIVHQYHLPGKFWCWHFWQQILQEPNRENHSYHSDNKIEPSLSTTWCFELYPIILQRMDMGLLGIIMELDIQVNVFPLSLGEMQKCMRFTNRNLRIKYVGHSTNYYYLVNSAICIRPFILVLNGLSGNIVTVI